ncbi:SDR family oxidoreductase [Aliikangiella marina]|uniref:SDR family oxidoreductase n=1 Tax=Aliikangiella marina TaxID=1712262 RepID=A0A545T569_9GAMM|nr:SDR family oxidoreductase [Aliikangiella marina]TQV72366.1 SDR family oxidoreductase [Aliikangiella marina]
MKVSYWIVFFSFILFHSGSVNASEQKAVLVTGATSGIGLRITEHLSSQGYFVYAGARKDEDMQRLNKLKNVQAVRLDVNKQAQIDAAVKTIQTAGRGLYGLVNNAGVAILGPLTETPENDFDFQMQVNLYGPYRVTKAFAPMIIESKGRISTIGSISGILSGPLFGPYSMSKHAIEAFTDSLAAEMAQFGVKVSVIEPGNYNSKIGENLKRRFKGKEKLLEQSRYKEAWTGVMERVGSRTQYKDPIDVAKAVEEALFNAAPKKRYLVVPNQREADITVRQAIREAVQLNFSHEYSLDQESLMKVLDEEIKRVSKK